MFIGFATDRSKTYVKTTEHYLEIDGVDPQWEFLRGGPKGGIPTVSWASGDLGPFGPWASGDPKPMGSIA